LGFSLAFGWLMSSALGLMAMEFWGLICPKRAARATAEVKANAYLPDANTTFDRQEPPDARMPRTKHSERPAAMAPIGVESASADKLPGAIPGSFLT
jgi:hypothetical protein